MSDERVFLDRPGITVTNRRFVVGSQTFALRNITSVRTDKETPGLTGAGILMLFGIALALIGFLNQGIFLSFIGIAALGGGFYVAWSRKDNFKLMLITSAKEVLAYESKDGQLISDVVKALNDAMAAGG